MRVHKCACVSLWSRWHSQYQRLLPMTNGAPLPALASRLAAPDKKRSRWAKEGPGQGLAVGGRRGQGAERVRRVACHGVAPDDGGRVVGVVDVARGAAPGEAGKPESQKPPPGRFNATLPAIQHSSTIETGIDGTTTHIAHNIREEAEKRCRGPGLLREELVARISMRRVVCSLLGLAFGPDWVPMRLPSCGTDESIAGQNSQQLWRRFQRLE